MLPVLNIGPLAVQTPMLLLLLGLWAGLSFGERYASRFKVEAKTLDDLVLISLLVGLVGARILYILRYPAAFMENITSVLSLNPGLFLPSGGLLVGGVTFLILIQRRKLDLWAVLDGLTLPLAIFGVFLGFSHLASGSFYGFQTHLPWAIELWGAPRHPTQLYEIIGAALVLLFVFRTVKGVPPDGDKTSISGILFLKFSVWTAIAWIVLATFQSDPPLFFFNIRTIQMIAAIVLAACFWLLREKINASKSETS